MRLTLAAAALIALAACSPKAADNEATPAPSAAVSGPQMKPGEWRTTVTMREIKMAGMPSGAMNLEPVVATDCVTSGELDGFLKRSAMDEDATGANCTINEMKAEGGRFAGRSECTDPDGATRTMQMAGSYGETRVDLTMDMAGQSPRGPMTAKMHMLAERIGDCKS